MSTAETTMIPTELGLPIPHLPHAISSSLPTWKDNLRYAKREPSVVKSMTTGYPRFFIHESLQRLVRFCEEKFGNHGERCMLISSTKLADVWRSFLLSQSPDPISVRIFHHTLPTQPSNAGYYDPSPQQDLELHMLFFPATSQTLAQMCWEYTGHGISSRRAERYLELLRIPLPDMPFPSARPPSTASSSSPGTPTGSSPGASVESLHDGPGPTQTARLVQCDEEPLPYADAKSALRRRLARAFEGDFPSTSETGPVPGNDGPGPYGLSADDVYLYPTGMSAIWQAHQLLLETVEKRGKVVGKTMCFGFSYCETLKVLGKWGPGCHFFGAGTDNELLQVRRVAQEAAASGAPILALFCEVSSNPLLRTPNLVELRKIADEFDFLIVVDDSVASFVNVDILEHTDIIVTSLSKMISGRANVMGGSLVLNPQRRHYAVLREHLNSNYEDVFWHEDVVCLEINSRDCAYRIDRMNRNAEVVAEWLWHQSEAYNGESQSSDGKKRSITNVFYPKWVMRENYDACRRRPSNAARPPLYPSGFGSLFTILFSNELAAEAFYDCLGCEKGPSWGSNFTLSCPYTIMAHFSELDWVAQYGVPITIVRISVGLEDEETILGWVKHAFEAAEKVLEVST